MSSNHVDEDYPARPSFQTISPWVRNNCGSESSTLETDDCVWRYVPLMVHATQEEEEDSGNSNPGNSNPGKSECDQRTFTV